jgi:diacylglycerol O-acyltransferase / wax synthase
VESYPDFIKRILSAMTDVLSMAERVAANGGDVEPNEFADLFPEITAFTERLRFNVIYRGPQKFACTEIPLSDVKAICKKCGTSVNDVILAIVTATIRRYCELHGDPVRGRLFRMMVPVNLRSKEDTSELGNRISLVPVTVPLSIRQPRRLLAAVHKRTEFLKRVHAAELVSLAGGLIGMFPTSIQGLAGPIASQLPITPFNLVCTNVPGPQFPLYLLGHKMLEWYPYVPVGGEMAVNCAILSYNGSIYFGFSGDVHAAPDLKRMEKLLLESFEELRQAVGLRPPKKIRVQRKRRVVAATTVPAELAPRSPTIINETLPPDPKRQPEAAPTPVPEASVGHFVVA